MKKEANLRNDSLTETYKDVEGILNKVAWRFCKKYGGEFDEWKAEANLSFMTACDLYTKKHGVFSSWVYFCTWTGLGTYAREMMKQSPKELTKAVDIAEIESQAPSTSFVSPLEILDQLSADAKTILNLLCNKTSGVCKEIKCPEKSNKCHQRAAIKRVLFKKGWSRPRVQQSIKNLEVLANG